ncbi:MAG: LUD domain-containing protein [Candidatus Aenigmarchaeota archaeon]|nr:LUD domain-containing protein [Candidatus Aenigmarchaeota archaeon]
MTRGEFVMRNWTVLADRSQVDRTIDALKANGIETFAVENGEEAKAMALSIIPEGSEVMNMTSATLDAIGLSKEILESGRFKSVRERLVSMDRSTQGAEMRRINAAPEYAIGSVQAVTENGSILIASGSGSQLPAYAYGAEKVVWVVGTQKIVKDIDEGMRRIYEHSLPLEDARARKVYGVGSGVNKLLIVNKERPGRITLIFVKERLGF